MEKILYTPNDRWGMTYIMKMGYVRITDNVGKIPEDWIARFYYADKRGNVFLKNKKGRKLCAILNPGIDLYSDDYMVLIHEEIKKMGDTKKEFQAVYPKLEKMISELS